MMLIGDEPQSYPSYRDIAPVRVKLRPTNQAGLQRRGWERLKADVNAPTQEQW
jgi:hypothetical protein